METEIWKKVPNYSTYEVSSFGRLKTFNWKNHGTEAIMKPALDGSGYLRTMLKRDDGKIHTIKVHRIVGSAFIPNPEDKPQINHKNGIRSDNRLSNLEWCTASENVKDSFASGRSNNQGMNCPTSILTDDQVREIRADYVGGNRNQYTGGLTRQKLADRYGVKLGAIKNILMNKTWKHLL